ncbi:GAF and ANTAR domain-containing protein [Streptomyces sp. NPDC050504]|uniref:GAF and ANTAR domain-containing protein n=1 Tax=Streptomyces sp. NPDC050504 TaxID=3365618 RepID=UPI00378FB030
MTAPPSPDPADFDGQALYQLQALLLDSDQLEEFLDDLVHLTTRTLPVEDLHCSVTLEPQGRPYTAAASDELVLRFDQEQYEAGEGPCLETLHTGRPHHADDLSREQRFGSFPSRAQTHGIRSMLALPLTPPGQKTTGVMNLYGTRVGSFPPAVRDHAAIFAGHAAGALGIALKVTSHAQHSADLQAALRSRTVIDLALGIIMGQQRCTADRAFQILSRASQNRNTKLRDVAAGIITQVTGQPPPTSPLFAPRTPPRP